jgi:outer membrane biosynthesis protein TonB
MIVEKDREKQQEKESKRFGLISTIIAHALLVALAFYMVAWTPPDPPIPQYGIEVNFGTDEAGFGEKQSDVKANKSESFEREKPSTPITKTETNTTVPKIEPLVTPSYVEEEIEEEIVKNTSPVVEESKEAVVVKESKPVEKEKKEEKVEKEEKPIEKPTEKPKEVNSETTLAGDDSKKGDTGNNDSPLANNNGNVEGANGDQGSKYGTLNSDALLGDSYGSGGNKPSLDMPGWRWGSVPNPKDPSGEVGKIVFEIKIDDSGEILSIKTLYRTVPKTIVDIYQQSLYEINFEPSDDAEPAPITTGKVTFIITAK